MAATFVVESGVGLPNSNSYSSVADADQYHENHGDPAAWSGASVSDKENALREATQYLDSKYGGRWRGRRVLFTQRLDWPRFNVVDQDGVLLDSSDVPRELEDACAELALKVVGGTTLFPDVTSPGTIKSELNKVGPVTEQIEYMGGKSQLTRFTLVDGILRRLLEETTSVRRG